MWCVVKGKGAYRLESKIHCMTGHREFGGIKGWCGQVMVIITPVEDSVEEKNPEVYCRKCKKAIGE